MTMAFLGEMLWKSALIASAALLLLRLLRAQAPGDRANVLRVSVLALLALPLVAVLAPAVQIAVLPAEPVAVFAGDPSIGAIPDTRPMTADEALPAGSAFASEATTWDNPGPLLAILYAGGVLMVLARLLAGLWTLRRWTRAAMPVRDPLWLSAFERLRAASGGSRRTRLLETVECGSPMSWGFIRPTILIDSDHIALHEDAEGILAHELAHVARGDWLMLMLMHVATAIFWFNPLVWWLQRETVQASEEAADARALQCAEPARYAQMLLSYADTSTAGIPANCMAPAAGLTRRVKAILAYGLSARPKRRWAAAAMLACVGVAAPISAAKLVAAQDETADGATAANRPQIASAEWAEAAGVPAAPTAPVAVREPVTRASAATPPTLVTPVTPATPATPATPVAAQAWAAASASAAATADIESLRAIAEAHGASDEAREAAREAMQDRIEHDEEMREAMIEAQREIARETSHGSWPVDVAKLGREIAVSVSDGIRDGWAVSAVSNAGVAEGMRSGAVGMEEGARKMREDARKLRDPAYRKQVIARQKAQDWGHVPTDAELIAAIPRMESGADRMMEGAQKMRDGAVRAADGQRRAAEGQRRAALGEQRAREGMKRGAEQMLRGADRMDSGADRMLKAAQNLRNPEFRREQIKMARTWGEERTDAEMLRQIPELEKGARDMKRQAQEMRQQAKDMATS